MVTFKFTLISFLIEEKFFLKIGLSAMFCVHHCICCYSHKIVVITVEIMKQSAVVLLYPSLSPPASSPLQRLGATDCIGGRVTAVVPARAECPDSN